MTFVYAHRRAAKLGVLTFGVSVVTIMAAGNAQAVEPFEPPAQIFGYSVLSEAMRDEFTTLRERLGNERFNAFTSGGAAVAEVPVSVWTRLEFVHRNIEATGLDRTNPISQHEWEHDRGELAIGVDMPVQIGGGTALLGFSGHAVYGSATVHAFSPGEADVDSIGLGIGVEAAFFFDSGFYVDLQGRVTLWDTDVDFNPSNFSKSVDGLSGGLSLEAGKRIGFGSLAISPRIQVAYTDVDFDRITDRDGVVARQQNSDSLVLGAGVLTEYAIPDWGMSIYGDLSASWDVLADSSIRTSSGLVIKTGREDAWGFIAIGAAMPLGEGVSAYLQGEYGSALEEHFRESTSIGAQAGIRIGF